MPDPMVQSPLRRILCVDDDRDILRILQYTLESWGFEVITAPGGLEALELIERQGLPDLALVDIRMPDLDGLELSRRILSYCDLPIIMLTAVSDEETVVRAIEGLAEDYVVKPFRPRELVARVNRVMRRIHVLSAAGGRELEVDDGLRVDLVGHRLTVEGEKRSLTPTETKILSILIRRLGHTVHHEYLLSRVWPLEEVFEESLRVHIYRLRRKIEADPRRPRRLLTERGIGYRLEPA
ncbi:MAG: response regulator transcription factor [Acidobacteriota bacterium]|jgi:DNA-binding response OmpR family regulator